jgi:hypothetical protein
MNQLGPYSWLTGFAPRDPELTLRAVVALPAVSARDYSGDIATAVRGEARERWLCELLDASDFTRWLRCPWEPSPWRGEASWQVRGSGNPDLTEIVFTPDPESRDLELLVARCAVLTGWRSTSQGAKSRALRFLMEVQINRNFVPADEIGKQEMRSSSDRLTTEDIATYLRNVFAAVDLSVPVADHLLPASDLRSGYFGLWLTVRNVMMEDVVDLSSMNRVSGAFSRNDAVSTGSWSESEGPVGKSRGSVIADMFDHMLEGAGYRGIANCFDWLRSQ